MSNVRVSGDFLFRIVPWFIGFCFVLIITIWIVGGVVLYKSVDTVNEKGVKGVIEGLWCGKEPNCKLPEVK